MPAPPPAWDQSVWEQHGFELRCEWGAPGVTRLAPTSDVVIVVDVLSFCTSVEIATRRGAVVYPYAGPADELAAFAAARGAEAAGRHGSGSRYTLSPASLLEIAPGTRLVLPSPNGSTLSLAAGETPVLAGCLRNAAAVAAAAQALGRRIAVIPAGERWPDGTLRPALEDWLGAGALLTCMAGALSPEAEAAVAAFRAAAAALPAALMRCASGRELIARGHAADVELAAALDGGGSAPRLVEGAYRAL